MSRRIAGILAYAVALIVLVLAVEGGYSVVRWSRFDRSIIYDAYRMLVPAPQTAESADGLPVATREQIEALLPDMQAAGAGMGNVPYKDELVNDRAAINVVGEDGCLVQKPDLRKYTTYIRTADFDRFDPPSLFFDRDAALSPELQAFVDTYGVHLNEFTTLPTTERLTLPVVEADRKILIVGDSVAVGSMIGDAQTIASQLQQRNPQAQYVNLGVNGAAGADIICQLEKAAARYAGQIARIIYVYCENDFEPNDTFSTPEEIVAWLEEFAAANGNVPVTIVYAPYIYNIVPQLTRFPGSRGATRETYPDQHRRLIELAAAAGFDYVDIGDLAIEEAQVRETDFAVFSLFVDHLHLSEYGVARLIEKLPVD